MKTSALKDLLIQRIQFTEDEVFLNALKVITDMRAIDQGYDLNKFERQKITKAREQIRDGKSSTHEEVFEKVNAWLKEK